tara:strand:+ start:848 stop:1042 length:195 start_codon:yes stop_codon:yes gene_type:complete
MKAILITIALITIAGCESTLQDQVFKMQKFYLSGGDMDEADTSGPSELQPPVLGPEDNPDKEEL